jgi:hypothetical protein
VFKGSRDFVRRPDVVDDAVGVLNAMPCSIYKDLKIRFDSAQNRHAQYSDKKSRDLTGDYSERAKNIQREARANMTLFGQRMLDHRACCLVCKSEFEGHPSG